MKKLLTTALFATALLNTGCISTDSTSDKEQAKTEENQLRLLTTQPPESLDWSLERDQINKRTRLWNDPNKVSYIYLISYGKVMAFYTIKGKVSSVNSQITNPEQIKYYRQSLTTLPSPAEDGSYGSNGDGIFFFTTEKTYVEWAGSYMLCDKPLKLTTQPTLIRNIK